MKKCVISFGGSVLLSEQADETFYNSLKQFINDISKKYQLYIIVGGGAPARTYIKKGRSLGLSEKELDELGIASTRINAKLLGSYLKNDASVPQSIEEACQMKNQIIIMGGTTPGHSTDFVGAELSFRCQAECFIIATNVDGVYDKDPNTHQNAVLQKEIAADILLNTYGSEWQSAGKNMVIDGPALQLIAKHHIQTYVINGFHLNEIHHILSGNLFYGTKITF